LRWETWENHTKEEEERKKGKEMKGLRENESKEE
jgi:hypothetical protein